jgi:hypothetical protein
MASEWDCSKWAMFLSFNLGRPEKKEEVCGKSLDSDPTKWDWCIIWDIWRAIQPLFSPHELIKSRNPLGIQETVYLFCVRLVTGYGLHEQNLLTSRGWEFFSLTPCPDWLWGPPSFLSNGCWGDLFMGVKQSGHEADNSPPTSAEVKEWMELYLHSSIHLHGVMNS